VKLLDLLHRWSGGFIGLLLALLGLSGAILVHKDAWVNLPHASDSQLTDTATLSAAVSRIMQDPETRPDRITFASENFGLHRLGLKDEAGAYTDQSGRIVTQWDSHWDRAELWLFQFHHYLFAGETGEIVIGVVGIGGLLFVISGVILWWRTRKTFEFRIIPKRLSRPSILRHHRDLGIVAVPLLAMSLFTGTAMIFPSISALILGPSAPSTIAAAFKPPAPIEAKLADQHDWPAMMEAARSAFPDADFRILALPRKDNGFITLRMKQPEEWLPNGRTTLYFAADTGRLVEVRNALAHPVAARDYSMLYPLHAGKVGGLPYRIVTTLSGIVLTLLGSLAVWTFWFRRNKGKPASPERRTR
jgi:uncharacterized iron-regulated membrane protein